MSLLLFQSLSSSSLRFPPLLFFPQPPSSSRTAAFFSTKLSFKTLTKSLFFPSHRPPPNATLPASDQELLETLTGADGGDEVRSHLPAVRSYENDLSRLTLIGAVGFDQALTAAAADGGDAAEEHLSSGSPTMVVETVFPGSLDEHSTVSSRLFLPARKVKEKAKKMRSSLTSDILASAISRNILALTFRQVVIQHLWSFELALFCPGTERNMDDLPNPREIPTFFTLSSSDERVLNMLAEAICSCALEGTKSHYLQNAGGRGPNNIFGWFQKPQKIASTDSSVCIYKISEVEIVENAKKQVENFNMAKKKPTVRERKLKHKWWPPQTYSSVDKVGGYGLGFSAWINEYIPAYRLQINAHRFKDAKLEGWQKLSDNRWEALLTHFQMVELAGILDMFYEDQYTVPDKQLSCRLTAGTLNGSRNKISSSWKVLSAILAGGCVLVSIGILVRFCQPNLLKPRNSSTRQPHASISVSEMDGCQLVSLDSTEFEALSIYVVKKIKDALGRPGDIIFDRDLGAWIGELPSYLGRASGRDCIQEMVSCSEEVGAACLGGDEPINASSSAGVASSQEKNNMDVQPTAAQDVISYQVVLTRDGQIVGFMPTSRVAINHWAANPLAAVLYGGRKLSPGILEPGLKIPRPDRNSIVLIELLMSVKPESWFVLARPVR